MARSVKQWQAAVLHPPGQLHSEQRKRQFRRGPLERQQNHSPEVVHPWGQPPPCTQVLQGYVPAGLRFSQIGAGEPHGLHGPPPQPTQFPPIEPIETPVLVRNNPVPSDPAAMNLKNWRRDDLRASA